MSSPIDRSFKFLRLRSRKERSAKANQQLVLWRIRCISRANLPGSSYLFGQLEKPLWNQLDTRAYWSLSSPSSSGQTQSQPRLTFLVHGLRTYFGTTGCPATNRGTLHLDFRHPKLSRMPEVRFWNVRASNQLHLPAESLILGISTSCLIDS